jgi:hypothetical protein
MRAQMKWKIKRDEHEKKSNKKRKEQKRAERKLMKVAKHFA